jgi:hypothetical protein
MLSPKFAYLPNGVIREIIEYTGATYKKRNGKYMGQIPKDDHRYLILTKIPTKKIYNAQEHPLEFLSCVTLTLEDNRDNYIYLDVSTIILGDEHYINYNLYVVDKKKLCNRRNYHYSEKNQYRLCSSR